MQIANLGQEQLAVSCDCLRQESTDQSLYILQAGIAKNVI